MSAWPQEPCPLETIERHRDAAHPFPNFASDLPLTLCQRQILRAREEPFQEVYTGQSRATIGLDHKMKTERDANGIVIQDHSTRHDPQKSNDIPLASLIDQRR